MKNVDVKKLNEKLGDVIRSWKGLRDQTLTEYDEGTVTIEFLGLPIEYKLTRVDEVDAEGNTKSELRLRPTEKGNETIRELNEKIKEDFKKQLSDMYNLTLTYNGGSTMVGVPNDMIVRR